MAGQYLHKPLKIGAQHIGLNWSYMCYDFKMKMICNRTDFGEERLYQADGAETR
jgi:hypothetical protein